MLNSGSISLIFNLWMDFIMTESVRCPACRGSKKVPKLGGVIGDCNLCQGKGSILAVDKPKPVIVEPHVSQSEIINAVADSVPVSDRVIKSAPVEGTIPREKIKAAVTAASNDIKIDGKKALYKRKKA